METERPEYTLSVKVTFADREKFQDIAQAWGIGCSAVIKRLLLYVVEGKIESTELFKRYNLLKAASEREQAHHKDSDDDDKVLLRVVVSSDFYSRLANLTDEWGSRPCLVMKAILQLFLAGEISKKDIW